MSRPLGCGDAQDGDVDPDADQVSLPLAHPHGSAEHRRAVRLEGAVSAGEVREQELAVLVANGEVARRDPLVVQDDVAFLGAAEDDRCLRDADDLRRIPTPKNPDPGSL
jgi:hypothetical protein